MDYPSWVTPANLGIFSQDYSFDVNPLVIQYGANSGSSIIQINGSLPDGIRLDKTANVIKILGICTPTNNDITVKFTLRILQTNGGIADRTFTMVLSAIPLTPSWANQSSFLGYQNNTLPQSYKLLAIAPAGQHVTYSIVGVSVTPSVPVSISIDSLTGQLVCDASNVVMNNTVISVTVRATANLYSDIVCQIEVITLPGGPKWVTPAGVLGTFAGGDFLEIKLEAKDLNDQPITYSLESNPNNVPMTVAEDGLLYGRLDNVFYEVTYTITVKAKDVNSQYSLRTFKIIAVPSEALSLLQWVSPADCGSINDGMFHTVPIKATTKRNTAIVYNLTGGTLPPNLMVAKTNGVLEGYCEYHAVPKTYYFNISATDGYQTIVKQFRLHVNKVYGDIFFGIDIPISGPERNLWLADAGDARAREPGTKIIDEFNEIENPPRLRLIRGVVTGYDNANEIYNQLSPWLHQLDLQFGLVSNTAITSDNSLVYRNIEDFQQGANLSVYSQSVYNTSVQTNGIVTPINLENIRTKLIENRSYVNGGSGTGLIMSPILNWSTGSIIAVDIINPGSNYNNPPNITVTGSGTGANLRAILGCVGLDIVNSGNNWQVGDIIELDIGKYTSIGQITVTEIGPSGNIANFSIDYSGDYQQVPLTDNSTFDKNSYTSATFKIIWGVVGVEVINGGSNYQNSIALSSIGTETLPWWQTNWYPAIAIGNIVGISGSTISTLLNTESNSFYGTRWQPNYSVFYWEGIKWLGTSTFDDQFTTFDGDETRFEETESAYETVFDDNLTRFDNYYTLFDYIDPLEYDIAVLYGTTIFDDNSTIFDFYSTAFDKAIPKKNSNTVYNKLIRVNNKTYSGNNAVW